MTPVALLLIGFDRRDSRTDGAQGTSTLDLELFFSIMHTDHPKFYTNCTCTCMSLTGEIEGRTVLRGLGLLTWIFCTIKRSANIAQKQETCTKVVRQN